MYMQQSASLELQPVDLTSISQMIDEMSRTVSVWNGLDLDLDSAVSSARAIVADQYRTY